MALIHAYRTEHREMCCSRTALKEVVMTTRKQRKSKLKALLRNLSVHKCLECTDVELIKELIMEAGIPTGHRAQALLEFVLILKDSKKPMPSGTLMSLDRLLIVLELFDIKISVETGKMIVGETMCVSLVEIDPLTGEELALFYELSISKHGELVSSVANKAVLAKIEYYWLNW